ncbi:MULTISPECIES: replication protein P [unclassified Pseudomonas]|uniref:replication protein P n=1 Tax=unclassified Pseudomonas TaxID=196821 RepID=UPI001C60D44F|nr:MULTISPECIES: replication protein P [unclassified Pseudomonas]MBW5416063.1 hypothetical protein [Pseudomonas sp. MAG002Y]
MAAQSEDRYPAPLVIHGQVERVPRSQSAPTSGDLFTPVVEIDAGTANVIRQLFRQLRAICPYYRLSWKDQETFDTCRREWAAALIKEGITSCEQLRFGLDNLRAKGNGYIPSVATFLALCQPSPEQMGLPSVEQAFKQAIQCSHPLSDMDWTHKAIYHAAVQVGFDALQNGSPPITLEAFKRHYREACKLLLHDKPLLDMPDSRRPKRLSGPRGPVNTELAKAEIKKIRSALGRRSSS